MAIVMAYQKIKSPYGEEESNHQCEENDENSKAIININQRMAYEVMARTGVIWRSDDNRSIAG